MKASLSLVGCVPGAFLNAHPACHYQLQMLAQKLKDLLLTTSDMTLPFSLLFLSLVGMVKTPETLGHPQPHGTAKSGSEQVQGTQPLPWSRQLVTKPAEQD